MLWLCAGCVLPIGGEDEFRASYGHHFENYGGPPEPAVRNADPNHRRKVGIEDIDYRRGEHQLVVFTEQLIWRSWRRLSAPKTT